MCLDASGRGGASEEKRHLESPREWMGGGGGGVEVPESTNKGASRRAKGTLSPPASDDRLMTLDARWMSVSK